jgi:hypothetical protein
MKKYILILAVLFFGFNANSQVLITLLLGDKLNSPNVEFGLEGGINGTYISGLESHDFARKWNLGFYFDLKVKNQWSIYTGVLVKSNMGIDGLTDNDLKKLGASIYGKIDDPEIKLEGNYSHKMNTFLVPALLRYTFKSYIYAEFGPQFGLAYKSWIEFNRNIEGENYFNKEYDAIIKEYNKDKIHRIDAGLMAGVGYRLMKGKGWTIGVKYYYGFVDVYKDIKNSKNSSLFIKANIPIGVKGIEK